MNVLFINHTHVYGGAERHILWLARGLLDRGHGVHLAAPREGWLSRRCTDIGVACEHVPLRGLGDPWSHARIWWLVRRRKIDILHGHQRRSAFYGAMGSRSTRRPSVCTVHSMHTWKQFELNDRVIAVSAASRAFLESKGIPREKIALVHNGVPAPTEESLGRRTAFRDGIGLKERDVAIGMATRTVPHKGHDLLIEALALLHERHPRLHVCIAGSKDGEWFGTLTKLTTERGLDSRVHFLGYQEDVVPMLAAMDLYAVPSRTEALPLALLEALSVGLPVVAARIGGIPEILEHERDGLLCEPESATALAGQLERLLGDDVLRARLGANAKQTHRQRFSVDVMVRETERVYAELLEGAASATHG